MKKFLSNGAWVSGDRSHDICNPYNGQVVGSMSCASVDQVIEAARYAKAYRSQLTAFERSEVLFRTAAAVEHAAQAFAHSICAEAGLSLKDSRNEVSRAVGLLRVCAEEAKRLNGEAITTDVTSANIRRLAVTTREPIGLVCAITPYNRPLNQVVVKVGPAIAANNSIILKPSEKTPLTAIMFAETLIECGLPARMLSVVTGDPEQIGDPLVTCEYIDMLTFTGSAAIGERLARKAGLIRTAFELGDSGALIVMDDADLSAAARTGAAGAFSSAGQSCRGVKRLLVHERVADKFVGLLKAEAEKLKVGDPADPETDVGTLINEAASINVERLVNEALQAGAKLIFGGRRERAQYWPTVLDLVDRDAPLVQEETFGPCAPVVRIKNIDDAIACANATRYGLQTGIYTSNHGCALQAARELEVGAVIINGGPQFDSPNIPFGGVKKSGIGREGVKYAIQEMTTVKTVVF